MQILLTGATGFLGRAIAAQMVEAGHRVRALVRRECRELADLGVELRFGQVASFEDACAAAEGCEAVVHSAGCSDPLASIETLHEANVRSTDCLIGACELVGVPRLLLTSCASVAMPAGDIENRDERDALPETWPAALPHTKALAEQRVLAANSARLATCALRPHLLWGAGETRLLPTLLEMAKRGKFRLIGEPERKFDPCHVENAAHAHVLALARLEPGAESAGSAYFIGQGEPTTIEAFFNALLRAGGFPPEKRRMGGLTAKAMAAAARPGGESAGLVNPYLLDLFGRASWFNLNAARRDLGYQPRLSTAEGMSRLFTALTRERMQTRKP